MRDIEFYRTSTGFKPVEVFLDGLTPKDAKKVVWVIQLIKEIDLVPEQYFKKLVNTGEIWEARAQFGGNTFRILGFFAGSNKLVLCNGFKKKSQKIPAREIEIAELRRREYFKRRGG